MSCTPVQYHNDVMDEDICKRPWDCFALLSLGLILQILPSHLSDKNIDSSWKYPKMIWNFIYLEAYGLIITLTASL